MTLRQWLQPVWIGLMAMLSACGSDTGSDHASIIDGSGAPVPDMAVSGRVTGFGSVIVDGVRYTTDDALFYVNGEEASQEALAVGDYVTLFVTNDGAVSKAQAVYLETAVAGAVTSVDYTKESFTVLGQTIVVDDQTLFGNGFGQQSIAGIAAGSYVDVRGSVQSEGVIYATRIEMTDAETQRLSGQLKGLDENALTFSLSGVDVDYHNLSVNESLEEGAWISVSGQWQASTFEVQSLRLREDQLTQVGAQLTLNGKAYAIGDNGFGLAGRDVVVTAETEFKRGNFEQLVDGDELVLMGEIQADGTLVASWIDVKPAPFFVGYSSGFIAAFSSGENTMPGALPKGIWVAGYFYEIDDETLLIDFRLTESGSVLSFDDLRTNDFVFIRYVAPEPSNSNELTLAKARRVELRPMMMPMSPMHPN